MTPNPPSRSVITATSVTATAVPSESLRTSVLPVGLRIEPEPLVAEGRLRTDEGVGNLEEPPRLEMQPLDLRTLVLVENPVVCAVRNHHAHSLLGSRGQTAPFRTLRKPEVHWQRVIEEHAVFDIKIGQ